MALNKINNKTSKKRTSSVGSGRQNDVTPAMSSGEGPLKELQVQLDKKIKSLEKRKPNNKVGKSHKISSGGEDDASMGDQLDQLTDIKTAVDESVQAVNKLKDEHLSQLKRESMVRHRQELARLKWILTVQDTLNHLDAARHELLKPSAPGHDPILTKEQLNLIDSCRKFICPSCVEYDVRFSVQLDTSTNFIMHLYDERKRDALPGISFKTLKELLNKVSESRYFVQRKKGQVQSGVVSEPEEVPKVTEEVGPSEVTPQTQVSESQDIGSEQQNVDSENDPPKTPLTESNQESSNDSKDDIIVTTNQPENPKNQSRFHHEGNRSNRRGDNRGGRNDRRAPYQPDRQHRRPYHNRQQENHNGHNYQKYNKDQRHQGPPEGQTNPNHSGQQGDTNNADQGKPQNQLSTSGKANQHHAGTSSAYPILSPANYDPAVISARMGPANNYVPQPKVPNYEGHIVGSPSISETVGHDHNGQPAQPMPGMRDPQYPQVMMPGLPQVAYAQMPMPFMMGAGPDAQHQQAETMRLMHQQNVLQMHHLQDVQQQQHQQQRQQQQNQQHQQQSQQHQRARR